MNTEFEFDLVFATPTEIEEDTLLDALFEAGCDDAVVGLGTSKLVGVSLTRVGDEAEAVISEAVKQVMSALPEGSALREVKPDLVSLADVAARLDVSRQALQKRQMPPPSLGGLYRASEVLPFLERQPGKVRDALGSAHAWVCRRARSAKNQCAAKLGHIALAWRSSLLIQGMKA